MKPKTLSQLKEELLKEFDKGVAKPKCAFGYEMRIRDEIFTQPDWEKIKSFLSYALDTIAEKTAEKTCRLIDDIEIQDPNTSMKQWKQYKHIRNSIRDKWLGRGK